MHVEDVTEWMSTNCVSCMLIVFSCVCFFSTDFPSSEPHFFKRLLFFLCWNCEAPSTTIDIMWRKEVPHLPKTRDSRDHLFPFCFSFWAIMMFLFFIFIFFIIGVIDLRNVNPFCSSLFVYYVLCLVSGSGGYHGYCTVRGSGGYCMLWAYWCPVIPVHSTAGWVQGASCSL